MLPAVAWAQPSRRPPVIDMHVHALNVADFGPGPAMCSDNRAIVWSGWDPRAPFDLGKAGSCTGPMWPAPKTDSALMRETLRVFERYDIRAVTFGPTDEVMKWQAASPTRVIPGTSFFEVGRGPDGRPLYRDTTALRQLVREGKVRVFAEISAQYRGLSPSDPSLEPYYALAEELDIPVGIHMGEGPPGGPNVEGYSQYRVKLGNPLLLEDLLVRHPKLRVYVMHYGSPFIDEMIAILYSYPQVYVDVSQNDWGFPRRHFYSQLERLVDAGFGKRILFGSDGMIWPQTIALAIETIESAGFLTAEQKRDILYNNAARFLRLE